MPAIGVDPILDVTFSQGEVSKDDFWEGLQSLGLGHDLSRSDVSRVVESFQASLPREKAIAQWVRARRL